MTELAGAFTWEGLSCEAMLVVVDKTCTHAERDAGECPTCGHCEHELILNGACYYCGETELNVTIKPPQDDLVQLRRPSDEQS